MSRGAAVRLIAGDRTKGNVPTGDLLKYEHNSRRNKASCIAAVANKIADMVYEWLVEE
jgi:hypothetical protein